MTPIRSFAFGKKPKGDIAPPASIRFDAPATITRGADARRIHEVCVHVDIPTRSLLEAGALMCLAEKGWRGDVSVEVQGGEIVLRVRGAR